MKNLKFYVVVWCLIVDTAAFAQIQVDRQIQLTGSGTDAKITGIQSVSNTQDAASVGSIQNGRLVYATASGASNGFILNISPAIAAYDTGMVFNFLSNQNITGPATLKVNNMGAVPITKNINQPLAQCDIQAGQFVSAAFDGANFQIISTLPSTFLTAPTAATPIPAATQIVWNWNTVLGASGYKYNTVDDYTTATDNGTDTSYTQTGLNCGTGYTLYVWAYNTCAYSSFATLLQTSTATVVLDQTSELSGTSATNSFTINTTNANEIILVGVNGDGYAFSNNISVDALPLTQVANQYNNNVTLVLYACVAPTAGSHTVTITWSPQYPPNSIAYAASFTGFCGVPTVAANVQATSVIGTTTVSTSITPAVANSCLFADYANRSGQGGSDPGAGIVTWTNDTLLRTDHNTATDASMANSQQSGTSNITVTATDNVPSYYGIGTALVLAVVHP